MSFQIFLAGKILGTEAFLGSATNDIEGRAQWTSLFSELVPRALLAELGLSQLLLGTSGGDRFFLVIPAEFQARAEDFLTRCAADASLRTGGAIRLAWAVTENLGTWSDIRRRLDDDLQRRSGTPAASIGSDIFEPGRGGRAEDFQKFAAELRGVETVGWTAAEPARICIGTEGEHHWQLLTLPLVRHVAMNDQDTGPAGLRTLGARAKGRRVWGVLRGSIDGLSARLQKSLTVEEYLATSEMFKRFLVGEIGVVCALPEYWRKVSVLSAGLNGFALYGAWDALIGFARELQRVFHIFVEANLRDHAGPEGKSISMALALARSSEQSLGDVYADAGDLLGIAKAAGRDSIHVFHRVLEWKQLADAADTKQVMTRLIRDFRCPPDLLNELAWYYRESDARQGIQSRTAADRVERPWRFHRRINMVLDASRIPQHNREFQRLRAELVSDFTGKKAAHIRLRPQGRVALEWAKLETSV
jgi:CRISPR-associated protein Csm1